MIDPSKTLDAELRGGGAVTIPVGNLTNAVDGNTNEATAYPFWYIAVRGLNGRNVILAGIWFSRAAAEDHLRVKGYNYSAKAFVYCGSGHMSADWRGLLDSVRAAQSDKAVTQ